MSTEFSLKGIPEEELYVNQTPEEKQRIKKEAIEMAKKRGVKPTARYYKTYPGTIRNWLHQEQEK